MALLSIEENRTASQIAKTYTKEQLTKEAYRLNQLATRKAKRLEKSGFTKYNSYKRFQNTGTIKPKSMTKSQLAKALIDLNYTVNQTTFSVKRIKQTTTKTIETLHKNGYGFIDKSNFKDFYDFMNDAKNKDEERQLDSKQIATLYNENKRLKIPENLLNDKFDEWVRNADELKDIPAYDVSNPPTYKSGKKMSARQYYNKYLKEFQNTMDDYE